MPTFLSVLPTDIMSAVTLSAAVGIGGRKTTCRHFPARCEVASRSQTDLEDQGIGRVGVWLDICVRNARWRHAQTIRTIFLSVETQGPDLERRV